MYSLKRCQISHKIIRRRSRMGITNPDTYFAFTFDLQKSLSHKIIRRRPRMGITNPNVYFAFSFDL